MAKKRLSIAQKLKNINEDYDLQLTREDIYVFKDEIYLPTKAVIVIFNTPYTNFSQIYPKKIASKVRSMKLARTKFYSIDNITDLLAESMVTGKTIFELCDIAAKKKNKRKKK